MWSVVQDAYCELPFTDLDYFVFTDAARYMVVGISPYERFTYRYSPVVAASLIPNVLSQPFFRQTLFCGRGLYDWMARSGNFELLRVFAEDQSSLSNLLVI